MICPACGRDMICKRRNALWESWWCGCMRSGREPVASKRDRGPTRTRKKLIAAGYPPGKKRRWRP